MKLDVLTKKLELIQWLSTIEDESIINKLRKFQEDETKDWWQQISEEEKSSINKGIEQANNKDLKTHSEAIKVYEKWL